MAKSVNIFKTLSQSTIGMLWIYEFKEKTIPRNVLMLINDTPVSWNNYVKVIILCHIQYVQNTVQNYQYYTMF